MPDVVDHGKKLMVIVRVTGDAVQLGVDALETVVDALAQVGVLDVMGHGTVLLLQFGHVLLLIGQLLE